jgi:hypothetical protein
MGGALKSKLPSKFKTLVAKCLQGTLLCLGHLANRHNKVNSSFPIYSSVYEDIKHTLFSCEGKKEIWKMGLSNLVEEECDLHR